MQFTRKGYILLFLAVLVSALSANVLLAESSRRNGFLFMSDEHQRELSNLIAVPRSLNRDARKKLPRVSRIRHLENINIVVPRIGRLKISLQDKRNIRWLPMTGEERDFVTDQSLFFQGTGMFRSRRALRKGKKKTEREVKSRKGEVPISASFIPRARDSKIYTLRISFSTKTRRRARTMDVSIVSTVNMDARGKRGKIRTRVEQTPVSFDSAGCGMDHEHDDLDMSYQDPADSDSSTAHLRAAGMKAAVLEMRITGSYDWLQEFGDQAGARMVDILNTAEATTYLPQLNTTFDITEQNVQTNTASLTASSVMDTILRDWTTRQPDFPENVDLSHLFVSRAPSNSTIGIAWVGTLCYPSAQYRRYGTGVTNSRAAGANLPFSAEWRIFAHEVGHNAGMPHDSQSGSCSGTGYGYLMYPSISDASQFSPCSIEQATPYFNASCTDSRVPPPPTPYTVSGTLKDETGAVIGGAKVTAIVDGITYTAMTGAEGQFTFVDVLGPAEITLTVDKTGYTFSPTTTNLNSNLSLNLIGQTQNFTVSGTVFDRELTPISGAQVQITVDGVTSSIQTASNGSFSKSLKYSRYYTIQASKAGCFFARTSEATLYGDNVHSIVCDDP
ncbi:MAG: carboxypeptidase regulatory-like domain-containing protein [Bdellovibrionales bacterium]|nr:carboxypeptidase regulatory-like domain-containing protein [Bdellovibrionales bacterium]